MDKHILVIDDNNLVLSVLKDILTEAGFKVSTAEDVVYCNDIIYGKLPPDLIVMDINMPLMSGDHKARIIKNRPKSSKIPIILISGIGENELRAIAADCGADGFLAKPIRPLELIEKIEQILKGKSTV